MQIQPSEQLKLYNDAVDLMKEAKTWRDFHMCQLRFMELADFMDSKELVKQCMEQKQRLDVESKEAIYRDVKESVSKTTPKEKLSTTSKEPSNLILNKICKIAILIIVLSTIFATIYGLSSSKGDNSSKSETCGICGGRGVVTSKFLGEGTGIQRGFDTYYRCKGCHGTGID